MEQKAVETPQVEPEVNLQKSQLLYSVVTHRPRRQIQKPGRFGDYIGFAFYISQETVEIGEPSL